MYPYEDNSTQSVPNQAGLNGRSPADRIVYDQPTYVTCSDTVDLPYRRDNVLHTDLYLYVKPVRSVP